MTTPGPSGKSSIRIVLPPASIDCMAARVIRVASMPYHPFTGDGPPRAKAAISWISWRFRSEVRCIESFCSACDHFVSTVAVIRDQIDFALQPSEDHPSLRADEFERFFVF